MIKTHLKEALMQIHIIAAKEKVLKRLECTKGRNV